MDIGATRDGEIKGMNSATPLPAFPKKRYCLNCSKEFTAHELRDIYCSIECFFEKQDVLNRQGHSKKVSVAGDTKKV